MAATGRLAGLRDKIASTTGSPIQAAAMRANDDIIAKPRASGDKPGVTAKMKAVASGKRVK